MGILGVMDLYVLKVDFKSYVFLLKKYSFGNTVL